jgi:hypothetical protein
MPDAGDLRTTQIAGRFDSLRPGHAPVPAANCRRGMWLAASVSAARAGCPVVVERGAEFEECCTLAVGELEGGANVGLATGWVGVGVGVGAQP